MRCDFSVGHVVWWTSDVTPPPYQGRWVRAVDGTLLWFDVTGDLTEAVAAYAWLRVE